MHVGYGYWLVLCTVDPDTVRYYPDLYGQVGPLSRLNVSDPDPDPTFFAYNNLYDFSIFILQRGPTLH